MEGDGTINYSIFRTILWGFTWLTLYNIGNTKNVNMIYVYVSEYFMILLENIKTDIYFVGFLINGPVAYLV